MSSAAMKYNTSCMLLVLVACDPNETGGSTLEMPKLTMGQKICFQIGKQKNLNYADQHLGSLTETPTGAGNAFMRWSALGDDDTPGNEWLWDEFVPHPGTFAQATITERQVLAAASLWVTVPHKSAAEYAWISPASGYAVGEMDGFSTDSLTMYDGTPILYTSSTDPDPMAPVFAAKNHMWEITGVPAVNGSVTTLNSSLGGPTEQNLHAMLNEGRGFLASQGTCKVVRFELPEGQGMNQPLPGETE